jgi:hypothetical protein
LRCGKEGTYPDYNLDAILARLLSYVVSHNESKPLYARAIATMVYEHIKEERKFRNIGTEILESNLLDFTLLINMKIIRMWKNDFVMYKYMVRHGSFTCTMLPRLEYFDRLSDKWIVEAEEPGWEEAPVAPANDAWEEVPEPPHREVFEEVHAPRAQDAWYEPSPPAHDA